MLILKVKENNRYQNLIITNTSNMIDVYRKTVPYSLRDPEERISGGVDGKFVQLFIDDTEVSNVFIKFNEEHCLDRLRAAEKRVDELVDIIRTCLIDQCASKVDLINLDCKNYNSPNRSIEGYIKHCAGEDSMGRNIELTIEEMVVTHFKISANGVINNDTLGKLIDKQNCKW